MWQTVINVTLQLASVHVDGAYNYVDLPISHEFYGLGISYRVGLGIERISINNINSCA